MAENEVLENGEGEVDYIETINQLKANSVNKSEYDKLKAENQKLLKSIINGETVDAPVASNEPDIDGLRKELFNGETEHTNLNYVKKALELRNALLEKGEADPFLPHGHEVALTGADYERAERVAAVFQECVDIADGNSDLFTAELMKRTTGTAMDRVKK